MNVIFGSKDNNSRKGDDRCEKRYEWFSDKGKDRRRDKYDLNWIHMRDECRCCKWCVDNQKERHKGTPMRVCLEEGAFQVRLK